MGQMTPQEARQHAMSILECADSAESDAFLVQKSSLADEDAIWFGCDDPNPRRLIPGSGWTPEPLPPGTICDTRLHLTQDQVAALLPVLQHFAETGELPADDAGDTERSE